MARTGTLYVLQLFHPAAFRVVTNHTIQAVCAVMFFSTFIIVGLSFMKPRSHRIFHYITAGITLVAGIAYFTMGSDLGETGIAVEFVRDNKPKVAGVIREIFYVRYIDWYAQFRVTLVHKARLAG